MFNAAAIVAGSGILTVYRKVHLWDRESLVFAAGTAAPPVVDTAVGRLGLCVCYDLEFPEFPRYGYYLDHLVDAVGENRPDRGCGLGGCPPHMLLATGLARLVVAYLVLSINTYLETNVLGGVFSLGYGRLGPTEARLALIVVNTLLGGCGRAPAVVLGPRGGRHRARRGRRSRWRALMGGLAGLAGGRAARNLRELARQEPASRPAAHTAP